MIKDRRENVNCFVCLTEKRRMSTMAAGKEGSDMTQNERLDYLIEAFRLDAGEEAESVPSVVTPRTAVSSRFSAAGASPAAIAPTEPIISSQISGLLRTLPQLHR